MTWIPRNPHSEEMEAAKARLSGVGYSCSAELDLKEGRETYLRRDTRKPWYLNMRTLIALNLHPTGLPAP